MEAIIFSFFLFLTPSLAIHDQMYPSCLTSNVTWDHSLIINTIPNVPTPEYCQQLCQLENNCVAMTWIMENNPIYPELCSLFSATDTEIACPDCVSGPGQCFCSSQGECKIANDNLIDIFQGVTNEQSCHLICDATTDCSFYTFFTDNHPLRDLCFIFSSCEELDETCDQCITGPQNCQTCDFGQVVIDDECSACREDWTMYRGACYKLLTGYLNPADYRPICQAEGGDLVSIHSAEENSFVTSLFRTDPKAYAVYIGGYDCVPDQSINQCKWYDESAWDWSNFKEGQPNAGDDFCGLMMCYSTYDCELWVDVWGCSHAETDAVCKIVL